MGSSTRLGFFNKCSHSSRDCSASNGNAWSQSPCCRVPVRVLVYCPIPDPRVGDKPRRVSTESCHKNVSDGIREASRCFGTVDGIRKLTFIAADNETLVEPDKTGPVRVSSGRRAMATFVKSASMTGWMYIYVLNSSVFRGTFGVI